MKRLKVVLAGFACCMLLSSCQSTKMSQKSAESDVYEIEDLEVKSEISNNKKTKTVKKEKEPKKPFSWKAILGSKFIEGEPCSVFTATAFGGIKEQPAVVMINGKTGEAGFGSTYLAAFYVFQLDESGRNKLEIAMNQYLDDFANKKLNPALSKNKSKKLYGKVKASINYGTFKGSLPNSGEGTAYLGYKFVDKSPYFTISLPELPNKAMENGSAIEKSLDLSYFFTKNQIRTLVELLDNEKLMTAIRNHEVDLYGQAYVNEKYGLADDVDYDVYEVEE